MTLLRIALASLLLAAGCGRGTLAADEYGDYIGSIELVGFPFCPVGSYPAWGELLPTGTYGALFALLGNRFGGDSSQGSFALPDLRDRTPTGMTWCVVLEGPFPAHP